MRLYQTFPLLLALAACSTTTVHEDEATHTQPAVLDEASVKPGINERWTDPGLDVADAEATFESESREIYASRHALVEALGVRQGMRVADIGAGTGFMSFLFAETVGEEGRVYAVELSPVFVEHIRTSAAERGLEQVEAVQCTERTTELPMASVDAVFLCDTYHHFEYPRTTLASIRQALRRGGELWIVDFERIEGVSSDWVLGHVRAGSAEVTAELEEAGFEVQGLVDVPGLEENYLIRARLP